jgi:hypothetical protein
MNDVEMFCRQLADRQRIERHAGAVAMFLLR